MSVPFLVNNVFKNHFLFIQVAMWRDYWISTRLKWQATCIKILLSTINKRVICILHKWIIITAERPREYKCDNKSNLHGIFSQSCRLCSICWLFCIFLFLVIRIHSTGSCVFSVSCHLFRFVCGKRRQKSNS